MTFASAIVLAALATALPARTSAAPLITEAEAKHPPQKGAVPNWRGVTRGPKIQVPDAETAPQISPIRF